MHKFDWTGICITVGALGASLIVLLPLWRPFHQEDLWFILSLTLFYLAFMGDMVLAYWQRRDPWWYVPFRKRK